MSEIELWLLTCTICAVDFWIHITVIFYVLLLINFRAIVRQQDSLLLIDSAYLQC